MTGSLINNCANLFLIRNSSFRSIISLRWYSSWNNNAPLSLLLHHHQNSSPIMNHNNQLCYQRNEREPIIVGRFISTSCALFAEPLKKKKKMDPAIIRAREEKRKRRLEKQIRKLEKASRQLKPLEENEIPIQLVEEPSHRERRLQTLNSEEANDRWKLQKEWGRYRSAQHKQNIILFRKIMESQENALAQLRLVSEELYVAACEIDNDLLPYTCQGPVDTPPIEGYQTPSGDYFDISRKWE